MIGVKIVLGIISALFVCCALVMFFAEIDTWRDTSQEIPKSLSIIISLILFAIGVGGIVLACIKW